MSRKLFIPFHSIDMYLNKTITNLGVYRISVNATIKRSSTFNLAIFE